MVDDTMRVRVLLSLQRALLDAVTADLRAVAVRWTAARIEARFIYDCDDFARRLELVDAVETLVLADFDERVDTHFSAVAKPTGVLTIEPDEAWVFLRHDE